MSVLSEASKDYAADPCPAQMDQLIVAMMIAMEQNADVYAPGQIVYDADRNMKMEFGMVQASDGGWYGILCTSEEQVKKLPGAIPVPAKLRDMVTSARNTPGISGLVVDPGSCKNCVLTEAELGVLIDSFGKGQTFNAMPQNRTDADHPLN